MKKSIIAFVMLAVLLSSCSAHAQAFYTVRELQAQTAQGWHETYKAHGREIVVDIDVPVPPVEAMPVIKVELARMTPSSALEATGWRINCRPEDNVLIYEKQSPSDQLPEKFEKTCDAVYINPDDMKRAYAPGNELLLGEAIDIIKESFEMADLDPGEYLFDRPFELRVYGFYDPKTKEIVYPGEYCFSCYQVINNIPVLCHAGVALWKRIVPYYNAIMSGIIISDSAFSVFLHRVKPSKSIVDDIPLCGFETIRESIEKEINDGHIRQIFDLQLGLVLYDDPECAQKKGFRQSYYAVPAWQLRCLYLSNAKKELPEYSAETNFSVDSNEFATIVINAQTGKMQDYMGKVSHVDYAGFLSWDEVH